MGFFKDFKDDFSEAVIKEVAESKSLSLST